ncbi:hypothetical protein SDC9_91944 [bioreactor metagenome]|uniref:Uncharacterized protein n=2 Tax=root TaxID=1 RepID=A0A644ZXW4_9ZZZZ
MKTKTIQMPLPAEAAGGKPVRVSENSPETVIDIIHGSFVKLFGQTDTVKCIMATTNGVINLQFIGNGCVANMQIYEVKSTPDVWETFIPHKPIRKTLNAKKGGAV